MTVGFGLDALGGLEVDRAGFVCNQLFTIPLHAAGQGHGSGLPLPSRTAAHFSRL